MSKDYSFNVMPSVSISRSRFARKSQHKTSFNLGDIVPIYVDEVLPGDTRSFDMASLVRMSTPIAPIMDNIYIDYYAFFCPNRLLWVHWKEFMGENNTSAGIPSVSYSIPTIDIGSTGTALSRYFGLPNVSGTYYKVNALPFRMYALVYNEWFRNQNVIAPIAVQTGDTAGAVVGTTNDSQPGIRKAAKLADYFTKALPYAQKGQPVSIPLGTSAPVIASMSTAASVSTFDISAQYTIGNKTTTQFLGYPSGGGTAQNTSLSVDLSNATAATINQLRYAFQLQKLLEKDALYGSRYWEILASHFGIKAPDASLQRPEYLGGFRQNVNIDQVLQTTGSNVATPSQQTLGVPGANSVTGGKSSLFTKSFTEHGYIMVVAVARHDQTYGQGVNRMWSRSNRYDFYFPVFANLGAQEVRKKEIFVRGAAGGTSDDEIFGYQEAWAEYRYKPSIVSGILDPNVTGSLSYWTLANRFASMPTLGQTFIEQDRTALAGALVTGSTGPDFIADFYFQDIAVRPMPMYSIPGLIDHH